jgi:hypothetical protein
VALALSVTLVAQATKIQSSGTLPSSCTVGSVYLKTGTSAGFYVCLATNTWTQVGSGSGTVTTTGSPANGNLTKFSGASSVTNGDLSGDVTTSGALATTIANDAVTYAKLQNISATARALCRKSASAGDTEECTLSDVLDFIGSAAQGDILYRGASGWARLAAGTSGYVLTTNGAGANPGWGAVSGSSGGGMVLLQTLTASTSASLDFTSSISSTYDTYQIVFVNIVPASNTILQLLMSTDGGSTWDTSAIYDYAANFCYPGAEGAMTGTTNGTAFGFRDVNSTLSSNGSYNGTVMLYGPGSAKNKVIAGKVIIDDNGVGTLMLDWNGRYKSTTAVNAFQIKAASGNLTSGTVRVYGVAKTDGGWIILVVLLWRRHRFTEAVHAARRLQQARWAKAA